MQGRKEQAKVLMTREGMKEGVDGGAAESNGSVFAGNW